MGKKKKILISLLMVTLIVFSIFASGFASGVKVAFAEDLTKPDLIVTALHITPADPQNGDLVTMSADIKNVGAPIAANSNFTVGWDWGDGKYFWSDPFIATLGTNETVTVMCTAGQGVGTNSSQWKATPGKHTLNCMVDNYRADDPGYRWVDESNENNNVLTMDITVPGLECSRIRSAWDGVGFAYLYQDRDKVMYGTPAADDAASHWFIENKGSYVLIKNRATGNYLNVANNKGYVEASFADTSLDSAKWVIESSPNTGKTIKNISNGFYLNVEGKPGYARASEDYVQNSWTSACWNFAAVDLNASYTAPLPDLVVTNISWSPAIAVGGDKTTFSVTVKNVGAGAMPEGGHSCAVGINVDGHSPWFYTGTIPNPLAVGESCILTSIGSDIGAAQWTAVAGRHFVNAYVDDWQGPDNELTEERRIYHFVKESNEGNNTLSKGLPLIQPGEAPPPVPAQMAGATYVGESLIKQINKISDDKEEIKKSQQIRLAFNKFKDSEKPEIGDVDQLVKYAINNVVLGASNTANKEKSKFGAYWDEKYLYLVVKVADAAKFPANPDQLWNGDNVEVYVDANHCKDPGGYLSDDFQYMFGYKITVPQESKRNAVSGVRVKQLEYSQGYAVLASIPWTTLGKQPKLNDYIGLDVAVDDNFNGSVRDSQTIWNSPESNAWKFPSRFGDCRLVIDTKDPEQLPPVKPFDGSFKLAPTDYVVPVGRGAQVAWTEYEAEKAVTNGIVIGPSAALYDEAGEASGRKFVGLTNVGDFVTFTALKDANSIVVRYSIPDGANGGGIEAPIGVYVNGVKKQDLILSSKYCWNYGAFPWSNDPNQGGGHHYFDEARALIGDFKAGDKVTLKIDDNPNNAQYYDIDLLDMEQVAAPLAMPGGFVSITDYGAVANDPTKDATEAIYAAVKDAKAKNAAGVWIPEGTFYRTKGPHTANTNTGFSGSGYVTGMDIIGATAKIEPQGMPADGIYDVVLRYSNGTGTAQTITVHSARSKVGQKITLEPTGDWNTWSDKTISVFLKKGTSSIEFIHEDGDTGNANLDYVSVNGTKVKMEVGNGKDRAYLTCPIYLNNITIRGAGMWYSTLQGYYNQIYLTGDNCNFSDFAVFGETDSRTDELEDNAFGGSAGTGSSLKNIWIEHTKCGFWVGNSNYSRTDGLVIENCRFRNLMADGVNLCDGTINSTIVNCQARNTGDDSFAIWPAYYNQTQWGTDNNTIRNCTAQLPWLAQGIALYGGADNTVENNLIIDCPTSAGILISSTFTPCAPFSGTTKVLHNSIIRCGEVSQNMGALRIMCDRLDISGLVIDDLDIYNSVDCGIRFMAGTQGKALSNTTFSNILIKYCITNGIYASGDFIGSATFNNVAIENTGLTAYKNDSQNFTVTKGPGNTGW